MNLNKFNFYKNSKFFLLGALVILVAGLIVGLAGGLNLVEAIGSSIIVDFSLILLICMALIFVYLTIRYDSVTAFVFALELFLNCAITVSLCAIIRIPVSSNFAVALGFIMALTIIFNMIIFSKVKVLKHEKLNREELINNITKDSIKQILLITLVFLGVILISLIVVDSDVFMFVIPLIVGLIVAFIMAVFVSAPIWGYFYKDRPKKKKITQEDETVYFEGEENVKENNVDTNSQGELIKENKEM